MRNNNPLIINALNRRLGERLGLVCGGSLPRFSWLYAPDQPYFVYDRDDRSLLKKCWADATRCSGAPVGRAYVLAEWKRTTAYDHCGYGSGIRVPVAREFGYSPHFETALPPGILPTEEVNQNLIAEISRELDQSLEHDPDAVKHLAAEGADKAEAAKASEDKRWLESCKADYSEETGAFGNCSPGTAGGFLSWGGVGRSPLAPGEDAESEVNEPVSESAA